MGGEDPRVEPELGALLAGRYRLDARLGQGGFGAVYRALDVEGARPVALKLLSRPDDPARRRRFEREADLASQVEHPSLVPVLDAGEDPHLGAPFVVFELVEGLTLSALVLRQGALSERSAAGLLAQVASGLAAVHARGVVHRDIKPDNLMVRPDRDGTARALILDFGAARDLDRARTALTAPGGILGTPQFMSPEQAAGGAAQPASDLYSLGATAFFLLSGKPPFGDRPVAELLAAHLHEPPPPLPEGAGAPPTPALRALVKALLQKSPLARPASAQITTRLFSALAEGEAPDVTGQLAEARRQVFAASLPVGDSLATDPVGAGARAAVPPATTVRDAARLGETAPEPRPAPGPAAHPPPPGATARRALLAAETLDPATPNADADAEPNLPRAPEIPAAGPPDDRGAPVEAPPRPPPTTPPPPVARRFEGAELGPEPAAVTAGPPPKPRPTRGRGRSSAWLGVAFALLLGLTVALIVSVSRVDAPGGRSAPPPPATIEASPVAAPVAAPREPPLRRVRLSSRPEGAAVSVDGQPRGRTPLTLELGEDESQASLRLAGYFEETVRLDRETVQVELRSRPRPRRDAAPAPIDAGARFEAW